MYRGDTTCKTAALPEWWAAWQGGFAELHSADRDCSTRAHARGRDGATQTEAVCICDFVCATTCAATCTIYPSMGVWATIFEETGPCELERWKMEVQPDCFRRRARPLNTTGCVGSTWVATVPAAQGGTLGRW